jgi:hypothetical protein
MAAKARVGSKGDWAACVCSWTVSSFVWRYLAHRCVAVQAHNCHCRGECQCVEYLTVQQGPMWSGTLVQCSQTCLPAYPSGLRKIATDPHILVDINILQCVLVTGMQNEKFIYQLILGSYQYTPAAHVTVHCMIDINRLSLASWVQGGS